MKTIDTKSLLIGVLATILVMVTVGGASITAVPMAEIGRYQLQPKELFGRGLTTAVLLDTVTGDVYTTDSRLQPLPPNPWVKGKTIKKD